MHAFAGKMDATALHERIERLIQKEEFKDALKQAKVAFRQDASAENHRLFERVLYLRANELARRGLLPEAKDTVVQLLDLGVTDQDILGDLVLLLPRLGMGD